MYNKNIHYSVYNIDIYLREEENASQRLLIIETLWIVKIKSLVFRTINYYRNKDQVLLKKTTLSPKNKVHQSNTYKAQGSMQRICLTCATPLFQVLNFSLMWSGTSFLSASAFFLASASASRPRTWGMMSIRILSESDCFSINCIQQCCDLQ